jgi:hypothetical protein
MIMFHLFIAVTYSLEGVSVDMSLLGSKVGVISLGMSCQGSHQIDLHATLIAELVGDRSAKVSGFPFDNTICPPDAAARLLRADRFHPASPDELTISGEAGAYWTEMGVHYWHEFRPVRSGILRRKKMDPPESFRRLTGKYGHTAAKFRQLAGLERLVFVISNSQNNLDMVARVTGNLDVVLDLEQIDALAAQTDAYFGRRCEYLVATYRSRLRGNSSRGNVSVHELSPDGSEWMGDPAQWAALFRTALAPKA